MSNSRSSVLQGPRVANACADTKGNCDAVENISLSENELRIVEIGEANFCSEVIQSKLPVLLGFLAPWSRPFQGLEAILDGVMTACDGSVKVAWVNVDDNPNLSASYRIQSIPTLLYFVDGRPRVRVVGTASKEGILSELKPFTETAWRQEHNL